MIVKNSPKTTHTCKISRFHWIQWSLEAITKWLCVCLLNDSLSTALHAPTGKARYDYV